MTTPKVKFFNSSMGESVAYAVHGSGPFLLVPAWWISHLELDWQSDDFQRFFQRLGEQHSVVRYDRPGVGLSERKRSQFELTDEVTILSELIDHLGASSCSLLGLSCGGPTAIVYTQLNPHRVEKLVLVNSFVEGADIGSGEMKAALCALISASWGVGAKAIIDLFDPSMASEQRRALGKIHRESASTEMALNLLLLTYKMDARDAAKNIIKPTLILHRSDDRTISFSAGKRLATMIPNSEFKSFGGRAHLPWIGHEAQAFVKEILAFTAPDNTSIQKDSLGLNQFRQMGDVWVVSYMQKTVHVKDALGLHDLQQLIASPGKEFHARFLASGVTMETQSPDQITEILDTKALKQYRQRLVDIEAEQHQAERQGEQSRYQRLENESELLQRELTAALGLGGA